MFEDGAEPGCHKRCGPGNKPVDHHGDMMGRCAQHHACQRPYLKATDLSEHIQRTVGVWPRHGYGLLNDLDFPMEHCVVKSCPAAGHVLHRLFGYYRTDGAGRGGVSDAHIACPNDVETAVDLFLNHLYACRDRAQGLPAAHGRAHRHVPGTGRDLPGDERWMVVQSGCYPHIHHHHPGTDVPGKDVDGRTPQEEVLYHLGRHLLWVGAYSLGDYAVIAGHRNDGLLSEVRDRLSPDGCKLNRQLLKPAKASTGFRQPFLPGPRRRHRLLIERLYRPYHPLDRGLVVMQHYLISAPVSANSSGWMILAISSRPSIILGPGLLVVSVSLMK